MSRHQILALLMGAETVVAIEDIMPDVVVIVMVKPQIRVRQTAVETALAILDIGQDVAETAMDREQRLALQMDVVIVHQHMVQHLAIL